MADRDALRRRWFQLGVCALNFTMRVVPDDGTSGDYYLCPLCWLLFDAAELEPPNPNLTIEDVPPKSVGGSPMVLTCKRCNNLAGTSVDADAQRHAKIKQMLAGKGGKVTLKVNREVTAEVELGSNGEPMYKFDRKRSNPQVYDPLIGALDGEGGTDNLAQRFDVKLQLGYSPSRASLSYLRAAFLVVFARFGYRAVLADAFRPLRRALRDLDVSILPLVPILKPFPGYGQTWYGAQHDDLGSVLIVSFEHCTVVLPDPLRHDESWWHINPAPNSDFDIKTAIPWPTGPEHVLDFARPKSVGSDDVEAVDLFGD